MYLQGENFYYFLNGDELKLTVLGSFELENGIFLVAECDYENNYVFKYDEDIDEMLIIEDTEEAEKILEYWNDKYSELDLIE